MRGFMLVSVGLAATMGCGNNKTTYQYDAGTDLRGRDFSVIDMNGPFTWTQRTATTAGSSGAITADLNTVVWDGARFLAAGSANTIVTSVAPTPGIVYTGLVASVGGSSEGFTFNQLASSGQYACGIGSATTGSVRLACVDPNSGDLHTFTDHTGDLGGLGGSTALSAISFNAVFMVTAPSGKMWFSTNGNPDWSAFTGTDGDNLRALFPTGSAPDVTSNAMTYTWLGVGTNGKIDSVSYNTAPPAVATYTQQAYPAGQTAQQLNAIAGTTATSTPAQTDFYVAVGNGTVPPGGTTDQLYKQGTSAWQRASATTGSTTLALHGVVYASHHFIAVGDKNTVLVSTTDEPTGWTTLSLPLATGVPANLNGVVTLNAIAAGRDVVVIVGTNGVIYTAPVTL